MESPPIKYENPMCMLVSLSLSHQICICMKLFLGH